VVGGERPTAVVVQINRRRKESAEKDALALDLKR
jgi:hypothetical protein